MPARVMCHALPISWAGELRTFTSYALIVSYSHNIAAEQKAQVFIQSRSLQNCLIQVCLNHTKKNNMFRADTFVCGANRQAGQVQLM